MAELENLGLWRFGELNSSVLGARLTGKTPRDAMFEMMRRLAVRQERVILLAIAADIATRPQTEETGIDYDEYAILICPTGRGGIEAHLTDEQVLLLAWLPDIDPSATALVRKIGPKLVPQTP